MNLIRNSGNPNFVVGVFLLLLVAFMAGPNMLPRFVAQIAPGFYEGVPCTWLKRSEDRANHQSLIGRGSANPLSLSLVSNGIPATPDGIMTIQITVTNNTMGTVPFVFNPTQVIIGDNGTTGLGIIFSPPVSLGSLYNRPLEPITFPEADIRLLGPRQRCTYALDFPAGNVLADPTLSSGNVEVRAYYRSNTRGQIMQSSALATPIYPDQGLVANYYVESAPIRLARSGS